MALTLEQIRQTSSAPTGGAMSLAQIKAGAGIVSPEVTPAVPEPSGVQKALGAFLDPIIASGVRAGQAIGALALKGANIATGGAIDKYARGGNLDEAMRAYLAKPTKLPITGGTLPAVAEETPETIAGRAVSTVALGAKAPATAGALLLAGSAMQEKKAAPEVAINAVVGAIGGKILEHGFNVVSPYVAKAATKYGKPFVDKIAQYIPDTAKTFLDDLAAKVPKTPALPKAISAGIEKGQEAADYVFNKPLSVVEGKVIQGFKWAKNKAVDSLESDYYKWAGATKSGVKRIGKIESKQAALNKAGTIGETPQRILAEARVVPEHTGTKFTTKEQADSFRASLKPLHEANDKAIQEASYSTQPTKISDLEKAAVAKARAGSMPEGDRKSLVDHIREEFSLLRERYGETMTIVEQNATKKAYWAGTKFDATKPFKGTAYYNVASSLQKNVEKVASDAGHGDVAQLNRAIGDRMEAARYLESLDGQTLKGGRLGKYVFMGIGASLGSTPAGRILGALGGDVVAQILISASVSNPAKRILLGNLKVNQPEVYDATIKWLAEQGAARDIRAALPPGIPRLPASTAPDVSGVVSFPAKRTFGVNPETGQFKRVYTSEPAVPGVQEGIKVSDVVSKPKVPEIGQISRKTGGQEGIYRYSEKPAGAVSRESVKKMSKTIPKGGR